MKKSNQKNHLPSEVKKIICELRDSGVQKKKEILKIFKLPRQTLKDLKPEREDKYKGIENYFVNHIKVYHGTLITKMGFQEKKQILKILQQLTNKPDETLKKLILDYQASWGSEDILSRRRKARIISSLEELPQTDTNSMESESIAEESQLTNSILKISDHQEDYQSYYPVRKQIKLIVVGQNDINQDQYHFDQQEQDDLQLEVYTQFDGESEPQFGQQFQNQTQLNSINLNDIDDYQYHSNQCYQVSFNEE